MRGETDGNEMAEYYKIKWVGEGGLRGEGGEINYHEKRGPWMRGESEGQQNGYLQHDGVSG